MKNVCHSFIRYCRCMLYNREKKIKKGNYQFVYSINRRMKCVEQQVGANGVRVASRVAGAERPDIAVYCRNRT